jgi:hypothetical protein
MSTYLSPTRLHNSSSPPRLLPEKVLGRNVLHRGSLELCANEQNQDQYICIYVHVYTYICVYMYISCGFRRHFAKCQKILRKISNLVCVCVALFYGTISGGHGSRDLLIRGLLTWGFVNLGGGMGSRGLLIRGLLTWGNSPPPPPPPL